MFKTQKSANPTTNRGAAPEMVEKQLVGVAFVDGMDVGWNLTDRKAVIAVASDSVKLGYAVPARAPLRRGRLHATRNISLAERRAAKQAQCGGARRARSAQLSGGRVPFDGRGRHLDADRDEGLHSQQGAARLRTSGRRRDRVSWLDLQSPRSIRRIGVEVALGFMV